jgi:hypothetical protein
MIRINYQTMTTLSVNLQISAAIRLNVSDGLFASHTIEVSVNSESHAFETIGSKVRRVAESLSIQTHFSDHSFGLN